MPELASRHAFHNLGDGVFLAATNHFAGHDLANRLVEHTGTDDKQMGPWFVKAANRERRVADVEFESKVLFYLWSEVFRDAPEKIFAPDIRTYDQLVERHDSGADVFTRDVLAVVRPPAPESAPPPSSLAMVVPPSGMEGVVLQPRAPSQGVGGTARVHFTLCFRTDWGQRLRIVGSQEGLGESLSVLGGGWVGMLAMLREFVGSWGIIVVGEGMVSLWHSMTV